VCSKWLLVVRAVMSLSACQVALARSQHRMTWSRSSEATLVQEGASLLRLIVAMYLAVSGHNIMYLFWELNLALILL
jgi:hypothetical protein